ncbi:MAG: acetyl-CoA C-acyltransferase, partial [Gammaproteobacteria bacterium]|nr:acetyl-CoA C-acyltransferase [Gammaproteobacteria bacterium]
IALGQIDVGIAGGVDTISDAPIVYPDDYRKLLMKSYRARSTGDRLKPWLGLRPRHFKPVSPGVTEPRTGLSMGESCELMAKDWSIARQAQDELALTSHQNLARAYDAGFYDGLVTPFMGVEQDNNLRRGTSMEKLAALKPVFDRSPTGTLTAGNSTPLTDGAGCVLLASEQWAQDRGLEVQAYLTHAKAAAVDFVGGEGLLMAPAYAVSEMLYQAGLQLQDFDLYEIHEAFACQVLCTLAAWESPDFCRDRLGRSPLGAIERSKLNVYGGSVASGHPFGATGSRLVGILAKALHTSEARRGLISVCTGGGMGVTAILESA